MLKLIGKLNLNIILIRPYVIMSVISFTTVLISVITDSEAIMGIFFDFTRFLYDLIFPSSVSKGEAGYFGEIFILALAILYFVALCISIIYEFVFIKKFKKQHCTKE